MCRQREADPRAGAPAEGARPVRLTDQALVAVTIARRHAGRRSPSTADLLVGLASEPDGRAAQALRRQETACTRLVGRAVTAPPRLAGLAVALGWAAREVEGRPLWTSDLLAAAREVGGSDLAELLASCGFDPHGLAVEPPDTVAPWEAIDAPERLAETRGFDPAGHAWSLPAARAVARARALGGGAVTLVVALAVEEALSPESVPLDVGELRARLRRRPSAAWPRLATPHAGDHGLDAVVAAGERIADPQRPLAPTDLLRAAILAGGADPAALLAPPEQDGGP